MADLSILIPARNEQFLRKTVEDVLEDSEADTEVLVCLDGAWANPPLPVHPKVHVVYRPKSIGQRAATNLLARLSTAKYVMKLDAHCSVGPGFDRILMEHAPYDWTIVPVMFNLAAFERKCKGCGHKAYQGPEEQACPKCKEAKGYERIMTWKPRLSRKSAFMCFDSELHFQYQGEQTLRPWFKEQEKTGFTDTMSILGAFWFLHRERYWELGILDESHGSWGQMGTEIACKTWLSGGRMVCNHKTWAAHMFRTQGGSFGFPYELKGADVDKARKYSQEMWRTNRWTKQVHTLDWLVRKFWPVKGWKDSDLDKITVKKPVTQTKGMVYYTENTLDPKILTACQKRLKECVNGHDLVSVSLKPIDFGRNLVLPLERGVLTMFKQILAGLESSTADIIFLTEHDLLYHPSHFEFTPPKRDVFYYNRHTWKVDAISGHALHYLCNQVSGLCAYRELLIEHYRKRVELVEQNGWNRNMGYEPGSHRPPRGVDYYGSEWWMSAQPNIDIRHQTNLSRNRWRQDQFRDKSTCLGWTESDRVPGWGITKGRFADFLSQWT